jgi:hypothetical protein
MSKTIIVGASAFVLALGIVVWRVNYSPSTSELPVEVKAAPPEAAPLCPWREPDADMKRFFPNADRCEVETRILSGLRVELAARLGRAPTGDENALRLYRVCQQTNALGTVLTRRVKGTHGAIEIVLAIDPENRVRGVRLQRLREPESVAAAIQNSAWLRAFEGKRAGDAWKLGGDIPDVPAEARESAGVIVEGVRSLLILMSAAGQSNVAIPAATSHH